MSNNGYSAHSGGLDFRLNGSGLKTRGDGFTWELALTGFGRGEQTATVPDAEITQNGNSLEYLRGSLTEWYRDTALGLEQGITIHQSPGGTGQLVIQFDLSTTLNVDLDVDGRGLSFMLPNERILRYDHLLAWDANGIQLDATLILKQGKVVLQVNDQGASYPITIDPLIYLEQKVFASDGAAEDLFGHSVALDGNTALVGAYLDDIDGNSNQGSVYVFVLNGIDWNLQQKLIASDGAAGNKFGDSISLSGNTALVGASGDDIDVNSDQGSAYIFVREGTIWSQQAKLITSDGAAEDYFGSSVALDDDTALVGAPGDDIETNVNQGSAYVFIYSETSWKLQAKLTASGPSEAEGFGYSVSLDDDTALIGSPFNEIPHHGAAGAAYIFVRMRTSWNQQAKLNAPNISGWDARFGHAVSLSGNTALIGARGEDFEVGIRIIRDQGSAYIFVRDGTTWHQQAKLTASDAAENDEFGISVAADDDIALVGSSHGQGTVYFFMYDGVTWNEQGVLTASDGDMGDKFSNVAVSGNIALVGAETDEFGTNDRQGSAYFYRYEVLPILTLIKPTGTLNGIAAPIFQWTVFPGATSYRLAVYSYSVASYLILNTVSKSYCNSNQCSYPSPVYFTNGDYKFKVLAYTPSGITPYSAWMSFTITGVTLLPPPHPPTPISPTGKVTTHHPTFTWSTVEYADFYRLGVYSYATTSYLILENVYPSCVADICSYTHSTIDLPNGNYKFKVLARNSSGYTVYSNWMSFTVSSNQPIAPTLLAPSGTVSRNPPEFRWSALNGATLYRLATYSFVTGSYIILADISPTACSGSECTYIPSTSLASGNYKFKMRTYNAYGYSGYSPFMNFTIP